MAHPFAQVQNLAPTLDELISDDELRDLARHDPYRDRGELSPDHQRLLAMILPELCADVLATRRTREQGSAPAPRDWIGSALVDLAISQRSRAAKAAERLASEHLAARAALIRTMVAAHGGSLSEPPPGAYPGPHSYELRLLTIYASGTTLEECLAEWIAAARRCAAAATDTETETRSAESLLT